MNGFLERIGERLLARLRPFRPGVAALLLLAGCASPPPAPLVPLPDYMMPTQEALTFRPWRVVVADSEGRHADVAGAFVAQLKQQLLRYGIQNIGSDAQTSRVLHKMLDAQAASGGEISVSDLDYEIARADGVIGVTIHGVTIPRSNEVTSRYDQKKKKTHYSYTTEVVVNGHYTVVTPGSGTARTVQFSKSKTHTSYDKPHQVSTQQMALDVARDVARGSQVMQPLYTLFPLVGYVAGEDEHHRDIRINRGRRHGVRRDREWDLVLVAREENPLMGAVETERVIGTAHTREVYDAYCVARCDSGRTRQRVKLGMKARARGFGFSFATLFSTP